MGQEADGQGPPHHRGDCPPRGDVRGGGGRPAALAAPAQPPDADKLARVQRPDRGLDDQQDGHVPIHAALQRRLGAEPRQPSLCPELPGCGRARSADYTPDEPRITPTPADTAAAAAGTNAVAGASVAALPDSPVTHVALLPTAIPVHADAQPRASRLVRLGRLADQCGHQALAHAYA